MLATALGNILSTVAANSFSFCNSGWKFLGGLPLILGLSALTGLNLVSLLMENSLSSFVDALHDMEVDDHSILVSYDVTSLFTNVPVDETIQILAEKAFKDDWFNKQHNLNITKSDLVELLNIATKNQLFQFEGSLYEQIDGVAMGSPLGPLMANTFMCSIEDRFRTKGNYPSSTNAMWMTH